MDAVCIDTTEPSQADDEPVDSAVEICRVCLLGNLIMRDLFVEGEVVSLSSKAMSFSTVKMVPGDGLPSQVCCECADKLESAYEFKLQVEQADNVLRERYDNLNIKEELFFNEVEVHLEGERHEENISESDTEVQYETNLEVLENQKPSMLKDHLELLQVEQLAQQEQEELDDESNNCHAQNQAIEEHILQTEGAYISEHVDDECVESVQKTSNLTDSEAITIEEHNYMVQQGYTLSTEEQEEIMEQDVDHVTAEYAIMMDEDEVQDESDNKREETIDSEKLEELNVDLNLDAENTDEIIQEKNIAKLENPENSDEENYFENLNLSSRLKQFQTDKTIDNNKVFFMCFLCDKQFLSKTVLKEHMHCHAEVRQTLSQKKTPEKSSKSSSLSPSKHQPSGKKPNKCPYCGKEYLYVISFNKHVKQHEKNEDEIISQTNINQESNNHNQDSMGSDDFDNTDTFEIITGEKDDGHFIYNENLETEQHVEDEETGITSATIHEDSTSTNTFPCDKCPEIFISKIEQKKHYINYHSFLNLKCNICVEESASLENFKKHRATHVLEGVLTEQDLANEMEIIESNCKNFEEESEQIENENEQGIDSFNDRKKFLPKSEDMINESIILKTKYRCKICLQEFTKKDHLRKHAEEHIMTRIPNYKCTECNKNFGNELTLRNHLIATNHRTIIQGNEYDPNKRLKRVAAKAAQKIIDKIKTEDNFDDSERDEDHDDNNGRHEFMSGTSAEKLLLSMKNKTYKSGNNRRDLECATCGRKCSSKQYLMKHMEQHVKDERAEQLQMEKKGKNTDMYKEYQRKKNCISGGFSNDTRDIDSDDDDDDGFDGGLDWPMDNHECTTCKKRYSTKKSLLRHQLLHEEPNFECDICNVKFYRKDKLKAHYDKCSEKNPDQVRKCNICGDTFENNEILREHRSKHVDEGILTEEDLRELEPGPEERRSGEKIARKRRTDIVGLECTECNKQYTSRKGLLRHIQVHEGKKYLCDICPKKFYRREHLKIHVAKHNMVKPYKCPRCSKRFIKEEQLSTHMTKHERTFKNKNKEPDSTSKRFLCEICSKSFTQSTTLVAHLRAHNGIKPYVCEVCARPFTTNAYLKMHMRTHTQERPYSCQYCARAFARADTLANHLTSHTGEAKYHCKYCPKKFRRLKSLKEHVFIHTGQRPYACPTCDRRFNNNGSRYAHTKRCKQNLIQNQSRQNQNPNQLQQQIHSQVQLQIHQHQHQAQIQQEPHATHIHCTTQNPNDPNQTIRITQAVGNTMQVVQSKSLKTITITRPDQIGSHQVMQHPDLLVPLILPLTVTLTDVDEEVILPEGTKIFTTT